MEQKRPIARCSAIQERLRKGASPPVELPIGQRSGLQVAVFEKGAGDAIGFMLRAEAEDVDDGRRSPEQPRGIALEGQVPRLGHYRAG
jgi:hypothetical protein